MVESVAVGCSYMKVHVLGGGHEVGASMLLLETGESRVVVDCGVRMGGAGSALPDLGGLGPQPVDAIFLTHAHLDHSGALPLLHAAMPGVPVYCTAPTRDIVRVMLLDALRVMEERMTREQDLPLYPPEAVEALVGRMRTLPFGATVRVGRSERTAVRLLPAGHILGAAMVSVDDPDGGVLVTGDISLADQATVAGLAVPSERYHVVVAESTYGGRLHSDREAETNRFLAKVREVVGRGGKLLVPAFALGRAQELLLILLRAFRKGLLPPIPVWADGLVREVCRAYTLHAGALAPFPRRLAERFGNPFLGVLEHVQPVSGGLAQRDAVLAGPPCVIVSSSGMLTGGPSLYYVQRLAEGPQHCIALTGYQDEESPGRRLQELAAGGERTLPLPGANVSVQCEVATYGLSAHIDGQELLQFLHRLAVEHAVFVHGEEEARRWLAARVAPAAAHLPRNGEVLDIPPAIRGRRAGPAPALGQGQPLTPEGAALLAGEWRRLGGSGRTVAVERLLDRWHGPGQWREAELNQAREALAASPHFEAPESNRREVFRVVGEDEALAAVARTLGPMPQHLVADAVATALPVSSGLQRTGLYPEQHRIVLTFAFPLKAKADHAATMRQLQEQTGWSFEIDPNPNTAALLETADRLLDGCVRLLKVGFNPTANRFQARVAAAPDADTERRLRQTVEEATGYGVVFTVAGAAPRLAAVRDAAGRMEINAAYARVDAAFVEAEPRLLRRGKKSDATGEYIELRFVTPEAGQRCAYRIEELSQELGWRLAVCDNVSPQELQRLAVSCLPEGTDVVGTPSIFAGEKTVRVSCRSALDAEVRGAAAARFHELTGWTLEPKGG